MTKTVAKHFYNVIVTDLTVEKKFQRKHTVKNCMSKVLL